MTPFIIWLEKEEIDQLIGNILRSDNDMTLNEILTSDELLTVAQNLLNQNKHLIELFKKIKPFDKMQQNVATVFGVKQKCDHYKEQVNKMKVHCSMHQDITNCSNCPIINKT
ncbi:MAG: hypothetical protein AB7O47_04555 [Flavobacteriales bacterium]